MSKQLRPLVIIVIFIGALAYIGAVVWAGVVSVNASEQQPAKLPGIVTQMITTIGTTLATHFGALFGISQFTGGNPRPIPKFYQAYIWATLPERKLDQEVAVPQAGEPTEQQFDTVQIAAAYLYFGSLLLACVFWAITGFSEFAADAVRNMTASFIGAIAGVIAVSLNVKKPKEE